MKTYIIISTESIVYFKDAQSLSEVRAYCLDVGIKPWAIKLA